MQQISTSIRLNTNMWARWPYKQMVYAQPSICPRKWDFEIQTDQLILARRPNLIIINRRKKKKRTCKIVDFAVSTDHRIKLKENEKKDKYLDLAWELKKLWNMKVTIIPIVIGTVTKRLSKELEDFEVGGWVETIQTTALRMARILRRVLGTCCHSNFSERPLAYLKNSSVTKNTE